MRDLCLLEIYRRVHRSLGDSRGQSTYGYFEVYGLHIIASTGGGWDHVSVSLPDKIPSWNMMKAVRELFFKPEETVVQIHPPKDREVNCHPYCLHLWRKQGFEMPLPPTEMIGRLNKTKK